MVQPVSKVDMQHAGGRGCVNPEIHAVKAVYAVIYVMYAARISLGSVGTGSISNSIIWDEICILFDMYIVASFNMYSMMIGVAPQTKPWCPGNFHIIGTDEMPGR